MLISEKQRREDLEHSETSLCYTALSLKVPSGSSTPESKHRLPTSKFYLLKNQAEDSVIYQCSNSGWQSAYNREQTVPVSHQGQQRMPLAF